MARNFNGRRIQHRSNVATMDWSQFDANELKAVIRDGLVAMNMVEREEFIGALEAQLRHVGLNMRAYLVPLGIPGRSPEDLTPTEVAHLIRFLKINVPRAMPAIERALARNTAFLPSEGRKERIAA